MSEQFVLEIAQGIPGATGATGATGKGLEDFFLATDYGIDPDNADNGDLIDELLEDVEDAGGGAIIWPRGIIQTSRNHVIPTNTHFVGQGPYVTVFRGTGTNQTILSVGDGSSNPGNVLLEGFSYDYTIAQTTSAAIRLRNGHNVTLRNIRSGTFGANAYQHIRLDGGASQYGYWLSDIELAGGSYGIVAGASGQVQELWIDRCQISTSTVAGISFQNASGVYGRSNSILACTKGIEMIPGNGQNNASFNLGALVLDTCTKNGLHIETSGTGYVYECVFTGLWVASSSSNASNEGNGLYISSGSTVVGLSLNGVQAVNNVRNGLHILAGERISITNPHCCLNSQGTANTYSGIYFGAGVSNFAVVGGVCGLINSPTLTNNQAYGIKIETGGSDQFSIVGVTMTGNVTDALSDGSTGRQKWIVACPGLAPSTFANWLSLLGASSGATTIAPAAAASGDLTLPAATDTLVGKATTDTLTNKSISLGTNTVTGTTAQFNTALSDGDFATLAGSETLTNKSISLGSNTVTGTKAQFNTALSDGDFASQAGTETLTNKTISDTLVMSRLPSAGWAIDSNTGSAISLGAAGGGSDIITIAAGSGFMVLGDHSTGSVAFTMFGGGATPVVTTNGVNTFVVGSTPGATEIGIYWDGSSAYKIKNGKASSASISVWGVKVRPSV